MDSMEGFFLNTHYTVSAVFVDMPNQARITNTHTIWLDNGFSTN